MVLGGTLSDPRTDDYEGLSIQFHTLGYAARILPRSGVLTPALDLTTLFQLPSITFSQYLLHDLDDYFGGPRGCQGLWEHENIFQHFSAAAHKHCHIKLVKKFAIWVAGVHSCMSCSVHEVYEVPDVEPLMVTAWRCGVGSRRHRWG